MDAKARFVRNGTTQIPKSVPLWLIIGYWVCTLIAVAVVLRRLLALAHPSRSGPAELANLDLVFASHARVTLAHIIPSLFFVLLAPFVLVRPLARFSWPERLLFPLGVIVGITAYGMSVYSVGGWTERSAVLFFNSMFLFSLARAWRFRQRQQTREKLEWLTRAIGILLGIATTRPVMGVFFATSRLTHLEPRQFFGIAFWIGFSINWIVAEIWIGNT
jgi:hypothetical protein